MTKAKEEEMKSVLLSAYCELDSIRDFFESEAASMSVLLRHMVWLLDLPKEEAE